MTADKRIITDAGLNRHVNVVGINETTISTGFTKVQVELLNKTSSAYSFRYHFSNGLTVRECWFKPQLPVGLTGAFKAREPWTLYPSLRPKPQKISD